MSRVQFAIKELKANYGKNLETKNLLQSLHM